MPSTDPHARALSGAGGVVVLGLAVAAAFAFTGWIAALVASGPLLPGRLQADPFTTLLAAVGDLAARLGAAVTLGAFMGIAFFAPLDAEGGLTAQGRRLARIAARTGQVWLWASLVQTCANPAFVNGVPLAYTLRPDAWWNFQTSTPSGLAWVASALVAAGCTVLGYTARRYAPFVLALATGTLALVFVAVTGNVTVGLNHDWATDASIWLTLALVPVLTASAGVLLLGREGGENGAASVSRRVGRYQRLVAPLLVLGMAGHAAVAWQQLAGTPPTASLYGLVSLGILGVLALLLAGWAVRPFGRRRYRSVVADGVLLIAYLALLAAESVVPSPRFLVPQSAQINYLGYEMSIPVTLGRLLAPGRPNWLWIGLSLAAIAAYAWGVAKVRRRGGHWPVARAIPWVAGWLLMLYLAVSGFWEYSTVVYSWHMFVHMTVNMLVPVLCVLGGPLTLLRAASLSRPAGQLPGPAEASDAIAGHRTFTRVFSPPVLWVNYVGSLFVIYYTPLFPWLMRYHWAHQLMLLYFMVTGYLFFNLIVGVDKQLHDLPHLVRLALVISIMPFHAIFAVGIMSAKGLIGADFYRSIDIAWVGDLMADQSIAGQITWILGEIPLFIVMLALAAQWFAHDRAENERHDAAVSAGEDHSLDAYNDMLAELAERDRQGSRRTYL